MYDVREGQPRRPPRYVMSAGTHMNNSTKTAWNDKNVVNDEIEKENANLISWATAEISVPGLRQLQNPNYNKIGKLFWFLAIVTSAGLCMYQVTNRCIYFSTSPVTNDVMLSRDSFLDFPATTICTPRSALFNPEAAEILVEKQFPENTSDPEIMKIRYDFWEKNIAKLGGNTTALWRLMSINLNNIDISDSCPNKTCFQKRYISTYKGDCVIIEAPEKVFHRGSLTGVSVIIKTLDSKIDDIDENLIKIYIHENDWTPIYFNYYDTSIYHGHIITITLTRRKFEFIDTDQEPCSTTKDVADCWRKCLEQNMAEIAGTNCRIPPMWENNMTVPLCSDANTLNKTQYSIIRRFELREKWQCIHCPRRCSEVLFNILQDVVKPGKNGNTELHIYIPDNTIDSLNEAYSYNFVTLLCELGGTLGLFLGFCSLTLLELIEVIFGFLIMQLKKRQRPSVENYKKFFNNSFKTGNGYRGGHNVPGHGPAGRHAHLSGHGYGDRGKFNNGNRHY